MLWFSQSLILLSLSLTLKSCFSCCIQEKNAILIFIIEWLLYNFCWCFLFLGKHATVMPWWENIAQLYPINHLIMAIKPIVIIALCWQGVLANSKVCWQMSWRINSVRLFVFIQVNFKFIQFMKKCFLWCWQLFYYFWKFQLKLWDTRMSWWDWSFTTDSSRQGRYLWSMQQESFNTEALRADPDSASCWTTIIGRRRRRLENLKRYL